MTGFNSPNYTQAPNDLFDTLMKDMSEAELKVVMVAIRKTFGYHKNQDAISFTQFQEMTGLSRQSVADGIEAAVKRGVLKIDGHGKRGVNIYSLVVILDQSENKTSTSQENGLDSAPTSLKSRHTKETKSKENTQKIPPNPRKRGSGSGKVSPREKVISAFTSNPIAVQLNTTFGNDIPAANMTVERMNKFTYAANDLIAIGYTPELITPALKVMAKKAEGWSHGYGLDAFLRYAPEILQALKQPKQPRQVQPDNTPFIPILYQAKIERGEMTREEVLSIMGSAS